MAKGKLPPQLRDYLEKQNKKKEEEDSKTPEGQKKVRDAKGKRAVKAAALFKRNDNKAQQAQNGKEAAKPVAQKDKK